MQKRISDVLLPARVKLQRSQEKCCLQNKVPTKCLGMCINRRAVKRRRGLTKTGSCKSHWTSIKSCTGSHKDEEIGKYLAG